MDFAYIVFSCNEWKDYSSMRVVGLAKNMSAVRRILDEEIHRRDMEIDGGDVWKYDDLSELNSALKYGYVEKHELQD